MGLEAVHRATVTSAKDPERLGRVQVEPPPELGLKAAWAAVATACCCEHAPAAGEQVLIAFEGGDAARPVVLGFLHDGTAPPPSKQVLDDGQGASATLEHGNIVIQGSGTVQIVAGSKIELTASVVTVDAPMAKFAGVVKCDQLLTNSVVASSYTPGVGNIW